MGKRMSKVICKLSMFKVTETWQLGVVGFAVYLQKKTKWMFKHKQSSSFDEVRSDQSIDALRTFFIWCKWVFLHTCRHRRGRSSFPDMPAQLLWLWREKPEQGTGMEEGETPQQWGLLVLLLLGAQRSQATATGSRRGYFALVSFCLSPAVAVLTNTALLASGIGKVAMRQAGSGCFNASNAAFWVKTCFSVNTKSESHKRLTGAEGKAMSGCMEGLLQSSSERTMGLFIIKMEEILLRVTPGWVTQQVTKIKCVSSLTLDMRFLIQLQNTNFKSVLLVLIAWVSSFQVQWDTIVFPQHNLQKSSR